MRPRRVRLHHTTDSGRFVEWCVVLPKSFQHFVFELVPRLHHSIVFLLSAFSLTWFEAIGSVSNPMSSDGVEQLVVESSGVRREAVALRGDQRLKGLQCLDCALEADRSWLDAVLCRGL